MEFTSRYPFWLPLWYIALLNTWLFINVPKKSPFLEPKEPAVFTLSWVSCVQVLLAHNIYLEDIVIFPATYIVSIINGKHRDITFYMPQVMRCIVPLYWLLSNNTYLPTDVVPFWIVCLGLHAANQAIAPLFEEFCEVHCLQLDKCPKILFGSWWHE